MVEERDTKEEKDMEEEERDTKEDRDMEKERDREEARNYLKSYKNVILSYPVKETERKNFSGVILSRLSKSVRN